MSTTIGAPRRAKCRPLVIALDCSGASAAQWCHLGEVLGPRYEVLAPEPYACESSGPWGGEHAFTLADEATRTIALIDRVEGKVHLVGHSYGGGVALHVALARPERIACMALYEASAFNLLRQIGEAGAEAFGEIAGVAGRVCHGVVTGDYHGAMAAFVDYWNGAGAWAQLRPTVRASLMRWAPKAPLDFRALIDEPTPASADRALRFPVLILRGEHAPTPTRVIAEGLSRLLPASRLAVVDGAGHMGPLTHAAQVSAFIAKHFAAVEPESDAGPRWRWHARERAEILADGSRPAEAVS
jgi:pimeloyl-ACP methyl ester carboxylesterase